MERLLTIIVPVYNGSEYLDTLFQCLERQTVKDFELVLVDDGSEDDTLLKMKECKKKATFPVVIKSIPGSGVSVARNIGAAEGAGRFLSFLDVDDRITENYVEYLKTESGKHNFDVLFFQSERVSEMGPFERKGKPIPSKKESNKKMLKRLALNPTAFGVYNLFFKRSFFENGHSFSEGYAYYEDYDLLFKVSTEAERIRYSKERLYFYVMQEGSAVASFNVERVKCIELLESLIPYFREHCKEFLDYYETLFIPRIYWSLMWQGSLAFKRCDAIDFSERMNMRERMKCLRRHRDPKIRISAKLYLISPRLFIFISKVFGGRKSKIEKTEYKPFSDYFNGK